MSCVIGVDIGTTSTVAIMIKPPDQVLALASLPVTLSAPQPGWAEQDPRDWWANLCALVPELLKQAQVTADSVAAIGVTGMLPAVVLLDEHQQLLRASIQQSDARCGEQVTELAAEIDETAFVRRTGNGINQQLVATKLRWIEQHEPRVFERIATVFGSYDYINWCLTGVKAVEQNWALEAGFVDLSTEQLSDDLIALARIPRRAVPPRLRSHDRLGVVTAGAAAKTGLRTGTLVVGGAADHIASAYAAGITGPGDVLLKFGGSTDILVATETAAPDARLFLDHHLIPGLYVPNGCMASGGSALNWFIDQFAAAERVRAAELGLRPHAHLDQLASATPPGADGVHVVPHFLGEKTPIHDAGARGAFLGLSLSHGLPHLWRALLESFGLAFRHHVAVLNELGHTTERFLASDGGARSQLWLQICADILGRPIARLEGHPGSCLGVAWIAALGCGLSSDWEGVKAFVSDGGTVTPDPNNAALYETAYLRYLDSYQALVSVREGRVPEPAGLR